MEIPEMIDQLGQFEAQAHLLAMEKQELIDAVKIPAEVQAIHDEGTKLKRELDISLSRQLAYLDEQEKEQLRAVVIPPEIQAALDAIDRKREQIRNDFNNQRSNIRSDVEKRKAQLDGEFSSKVVRVYSEIATRKQEITAEFAGKIDAVNTNITKLTAEIKAAVIQARDTFRGKIYKNYQAVFNKGRVTWNTDMLDGMIIAFPELAKARKEGAPSVTLRKN